MGDEEKRSPDLAELQAAKLRSEIEKNKAETEEIAKRLNQRKIFGIPVYQTIVGGILAGAFIITFSWTFLTPILNKDAEIAKRNDALSDIDNRLRRARLDSLNTELIAQKSRLETQVQLITDRLDSTQNRQQEELRLAKKELSNETSRSQSDANRIRQLTAQVSGLQEDIKSAEIEKKQIKKIAASPYLSNKQVTAMLVEKGFYDKRKNPNGTGITHGYEARTINGDKIVVDEATGLTWQQGGSDPLLFESAPAYIEELNRVGYAGINDWRLPTLEEAMSLMEPKKRSGDLYIHPVFDQPQRLIWTSDKGAASSAWVVFFYYGSCYDYRVYDAYYVRAVR